jgi:hypothetical protein
MKNIKAHITADMIPCMMNEKVVKSYAIIAIKIPIKMVEIDFKPRRPKRIA